MGTAFIDQTINTKSTKSQEALLVFAASSLAPVLDSLSENYKNSTGIEVSFTYGSSATLARQISAGAPANIFITADERWLNWLKSETKQEFSQMPLVENQLILATGTNMEIPRLTAAPTADILQTIFQNLDNKTIALADPDTVPLGHYTKESLAHLGLTNIFAPHVIHSNSAQANLRFLTSGAVSMAVIYQSDIKNNHELKQVFALPAASHSPIIYQASVLLNNLGEQGAEFLNYLKSAQANAIFIEYGFKPINITPKAQ